MQGLFITNDDATRIARPKSKKQVRETIARDPNLIYIEVTSAFGNEFNGNAADMPIGAPVYFVGPDPYTKRNFYGPLTRTDSGHVDGEVMNLPNVDLTAAAAELGLDHAPPFVWDHDPSIEKNAQYVPMHRLIHAHPTVYTRWAHTGLPEVLRIRNPRNGLKFTAAHELAHYYQERRNPDLFSTWGDYANEMKREKRAWRPGMTQVQATRAHRTNNKYEAEADAIARRIWRKVKLT